MEKKIINSPKAPAPIGPYNQAVKAGNFLFISGQIALVPETGELISSGIREETTRVMANLQQIVDDLSKLTVMEAAELSKMLEEK